MNLRQLECFFTVAETLHFGHAAERLYVSQASISEAVKALERELGRPLLERSTRRVQLTAGGVEFLKMVKPKHDSFLLAYSAFISGRACAEPIRIAHTPELGQAILPGFVRQLGIHQHLAAGLDWLPLMMHTDSQLTAVLEGRADIGVCWNPKLIEGLKSQTLVTCPYVVVLRDGDPLASGDSTVSLAELAKRELIVSSRTRNRAVHAWLLWHLRKAGINPTELHEVADFDEIAANVAATGRVGIHPVTLVLANVIPFVSFRLLTEPELQIDICAVSRAGSDDKRVQPLTDLLRASAWEGISGVLQRLELDLPSNVE